MRTTVCLLLALGLLLSGRAWAKPDYARKEQKACQYCHLSNNPGFLDPATNQREATTRNNRGKYYEAHNYSFAGYSELQVMGKESPPVFRLAWKDDLSEGVQRLAVGDVTGDGKPRLVTLSAITGKKDAATLRVQRWDGSAWNTEFTAETQAAPDRLQVGNYMGPGRPAAILTADALWSWNGKTFVRKPAAQPLPLFGGMRTNEGVERVLVAHSPTDIKAYRVAPDSPNWLTDAQNDPNLAQSAWGDMHATPAFLEQMGMPTLLSAGGLIGLWDVRKFGTQFLYYVRPDQDFDVKADPTTAKGNFIKAGQPTEKITLKGRAASIIFRNARDPKGNTVWTSPRLNGIVYDIALADPRNGGKAGFMVLLGEPNGGPKRMVAFYALD